MSSASHLPPAKIQHVSTPVLNIAYEQTGHDNGEPILLLHGFPYDVRVFDAMRGMLSEGGYRVIAPYLRGFGPTRFHSSETMRSGQQAALGRDVVDLLNALKIDRAALVGFDWGGRAACVAAALWPQRVSALVATIGYDIQDIALQASTPLLPEVEERYWYQWYFHTSRGRAGLELNREALARRFWKQWSPRWTWDEEVFASTLRSFENPDFVEVVIHSYRHRNGHAAGDPRYGVYEERLASLPVIAAPSIALHGAVDGVQAPHLSEGKESRFTGYYERIVIPGVGHCPPLEAPKLVVDAVNSLLKG